MCKFTYRVVFIQLDDGKIGYPYLSDICFDTKEMAIIHILNLGCVSDDGKYYYIDILGNKVFAYIVYN